MRTEKELNGVSLLGKETVYHQTYNPDVLEKFNNKHSDVDVVVELDCPEFTTLCPVTSQPDFGHIRIKYVPKNSLVESKSLKLYLFSFRNNGDFHEDCVTTIAKDLFKLLDPKWLEVRGDFMPRGGISINPFVRLESK